MSSAKKLLEAAAGNAGGAGLDIAEVFSTYLYEGTGTNAAQTFITVNNGIDLSGEGGLVWVKARTNPGTNSNNSYYSSGAGAHMITDSENGLTKQLSTNNTNAGINFGNAGPVFNNSGFVVGYNGYTDWNYDGYKYTSWTFRKAEKFFDVVTYTGTGSARTISHNLGSVPGMIIIKRLDGTSDWGVYHRSYGSGGPAGILNGTDAAFNLSTYWNNTNPTGTEFSLGSFANVNTNGATYVAYLFAHNDSDGDFGPDADQDVVKCGSFTTNSSGHVPEVNLGFEPQWIMIKQTNAANSWYIIDNMREYSMSKTAHLIAEGSAVESTWGVPYLGVPTATGFDGQGVGSGVANGTFIYMAIRAPMIAEPEAATDVFAIDEMDNSPTSPPSFYSNFPVDMAFYRDISTTSNTNIQSRLTGATQMQTNLSGHEASYSFAQFDFMDGWFDYNAAQSNYYSWMWKRAKGYMDVVAYTGTESARTVAHSLGVAPEMMWIKCRDAVHSWAAYHVALGNTGIIYLNSNEAAFSISGSTVLNNTTPTSSVFTVGANHVLNQSAKKYIAYLFATVAGISKLGSVAHSGSSTDVDCGFSNGARFVMLKRTDAAGDWYYWDSLRGIVAGNDPYMLLNTTAAQVTNTDYIDPLSSGFTITGDFTDGDYIFYAIA